MQKFSLIKIGLFIFLMAAVGSVNAVCVSIDRYVAPNGRKIYLFGDVHIGTQDMVYKERDAFIAAAKKRGAYCIVEDMWGYQGDNLHVRSALDDSCYQAMLSWDDKLKSPMSAFVGLTNRCIADDIMCFNAEWRYALTYDVNAFCQDVDDVVDDVRAYEDKGVNYNKYLLYFNENKGIKSSIRYENDLKSRVFSSLFTACVSTSAPLVDARVVHHLYQLFLNQDDRRDIFIFTGWLHINGICAYMEQNLQCVSSKIFPTILQGSFTFDGKLFNYQAADSYRDGALLSDIKGNLDNQEAAQRIVDLYSVDIANYFEVVACEEKMNRKELSSIKAELKRQEKEKGMLEKREDEEEWQR